jgi:predicted methyltransferase
MFMLRQSCSIASAALAAWVVAAVPVAHAADKVPAVITEAVADKSRPAEDQARDANRKPAEVLAFAGVHRGEHVAELLPGGGYFTRIFAKVVGDKGVVYAITPPPRPNAPAGAPDPAAAVNLIAAENKNVKVVPLNPEKLAPEPVDLVWTSDNYHDIHNRPNADLGAFNKAVFDALKPGGIYIVIDHAAAPGAGTSVTSTLHRIDPETVKSEVAAAGFKLVDESTVLKNPDDPHTAGVRDPSIRGKTDQFVLKFRKPT